MLCEPKKEGDLPSFTTHLFEIKQDGTRAVLHIKDGQIFRITNRRAESGNIFSKYPEFSYAKFNCETAIVDAEIVALKQGKPDFPLLSLRSHLENPREIALKSKLIPLTLICFDILYYDGNDVRGYPLEKRQELLKSILPPASPNIIASPTYEDWRGLWQSVLMGGLEGIVAKLKGSLYVNGDRGNWCKVKVVETDVVDVLGFEEGQGHRQRLGALITTLGKVGSGLTEKDIDYWVINHQKNKPLKCKIRYRHLNSANKAIEPVFICWVNGD
jgi:bifunctional non-homologous end joining protein LigD